MTHGEKLSKMKAHMDDLRIRNPRIYSQEERHLDIDEKRMGFEVSTSSMLPRNVRRMERSP